MGSAFLEGMQILCTRKLLQVFEAIGLVFKSQVEIFLIKLKFSQ